MCRKCNRYAPANRRPHGAARWYGPDRIGLVGFHDTAFVIAKPADAFASWLQTQAARLPMLVSGNCTNLAAGLDASLAVLRRTPLGVLRRMWLLSDGLPNRDTERIGPLVRAARDAHVNINTVAFGDAWGCDIGLLRRISRATHNGHFFTINNLRDLSEALIRGGESRNTLHHRAETTVLCIDLSGSMVQPMDGRRKIDVVVEAITALLRYKQSVWS